MGPLVCFLAIPPVISPVISPVEFFGEFSFETFGEISQLIPTVIPPAGLSGYSSSDSSG